MGRFRSGKPDVWRDALLLAFGGIGGAGIATFMCMCSTHHPDNPLPPLKGE